MNDRVSPLVREGWNGPGRRDAAITPLQPADDALHIDPPGRGAYEWWYFDAHLDSGHTIVVFFYAANPNPGMGGKPGVEIVLIRPDGRKTQHFAPYRKEEFVASLERPDVRIGGNYMKAAWPDSGMPEYEICVKEKGLACHLTYRAEVQRLEAGHRLLSVRDDGLFRLGGTLRARFRNRHDNRGRPEHRGQRGRVP